MAQKSAQRPQVGVIGLGDMGKNVASVLQLEGYSPVLYNRTPQKYDPFRNRRNFYLSKDIEDLARRLSSSEGTSTVITMLPPGQVTNNALEQLSKVMRQGDVIIDGSNTYYGESIANHNRLLEKGIFYLDVGFGGGPSAVLDHSVTLMIGGDLQAYEKSKPIFNAIAGKYEYLGPSPSGQIAKFVHNVMFYAKMAIEAEAYNNLEGFSRTYPEFDSARAASIISRSPPVTTDIPRAMNAALQQGVMNDDAKAPAITVSSIVRDGIQAAAKDGISFDISQGVMEKYPSITGNTAKVYAAAKKIITGH
jgi:6-phosphogluconate dehydrogenase (decarboxylating)